MGSNIAAKTAARMRILVISHTYIVGLNCDKLRQMAALLPDGRVVAGVPRRWRPGGVQAQAIQSTPLDEGQFQRVPLGHISQNHQGLLCFGKGLIPLLRQLRPHIIQVEQGTRSLALAQLILLNRLLGLQAKLVCFTWWNLPYQLRPPAQWLEAFNLRHCHGAIAGNQAGASILQTHGFTGHLTVLPQLGVDEHRFRPQPQPQLAASLGILPDTFVVGYVGRFVPEKGLLTLVQALAQCPDLPWRLLLLGRGPFRAQVDQEAIAHHIQHRLIWIDSVPHADVPRYLNLMQALVLPSETAKDAKTLTATGWQEQFGHVLIEAMACGIPVIGSDSGEIPHVIGDAGLIFPEGSVVELSDRLQQLMQSPTLAHTLAQQGRHRVLQHYTQRALAQQQLAFYTHLMTP